MTLRPKRLRVPNANEEFQDPLKDYSPKKYANKLERTLENDSVTLLTTRPFCTVSPDTSILDVLKLMVKNNIACVMVAEKDRLVGIFSERDVLNKLTERFDHIKHSPINLVMTYDPMVVYDTDPPAKAMMLMAVAGVRHVPILDINEKVVGIIGPRRIIAHLQKLLKIS